MRLKGVFLAAALGAATMVPLSAAMAEECDNAGGGQAGLNECYGNVFKKADAELNKLYREIEGRRKDDRSTKKNLIAASGFPIATRNAICKRPVVAAMSA